MIALDRLKSWEGDLVKYAIGTLDETTIATLVYNTKFLDEMEIRILTPEDRFSVPGHKSIMDNLSFDDFKKLVIKHIKRHTELNK